MTYLTKLLDIDSGKMHLHLYPPIVRTSFEETQPKMWQILGQEPIFTTLLGIILGCLGAYGIARTLHKVLLVMLLRVIVELPPAAPGLRRRAFCILCRKIIQRMSYAKHHYMDHIIRAFEDVLKTFAACLIVGHLFYVLEGLL